MCIVEVPDVSDHTQHTLAEDATLARIETLPLLPHALTTEYLRQVLVIVFLTFCINVWFEARVAFVSVWQGV